MNIDIKIFILDWILKANTFREKKDYLLEKMAEDYLDELLDEKEKMFKKTLDKNK